MSTMDLPLPRSGQVTHIIHLADVHIRGGDDEVARRAEYAAVFDSLLDSLAGMPAVQAGSAVIVMAGDLIHSRRAAEASTIAQLNDLFRRLSLLAPVYIFSGNHETDTLSLSESAAAYSTLDVLGIQVKSAIAWMERAGGRCPLAYLEHSGLYRAGNVGFGFVAMKDSLRAGNTRGYERDLRAFPSAADLPAEVTHRFALFHGTVTCKCGAQGRAMSGVSLDWFGAGYDGCILGDYHVQTVRNAAPAVPQETLSPSHNAGMYQLPPPNSTAPLVWAYPGSTIAQDMGEALFGHGFLTWDLQQRTVSRYHVPNARGLVTVRRTDGEELEMCTGRSGDREAWVSPARAMATLPWLPRRLTVRVTGDRTSACDVAQADAALRGAGFEVERIYHQDCVGEDSRDGAEDRDEGHGRSMAFYNTPDAWVEHLAASHHADVPLDELLGGQPWQAWLREPDLQQAPELPSAVNALMTEKASQASAKRKNDIAKEVAVFRDASAHNGEAQRRSPLKLVSMTWRYMLCYGTHNWLDFRSMTGHVVLLRGRNSAGKSSILEIICWAVFGSGIPSREVKSQSAAVVCTGRKHGERALVSAVLDVGGVMYQIHRPIDVKESTSGTSSNEATVSRLSSDEDGGNVHAHEVASGKSAVDAWVVRHVGDIASFLASTMLTQHGDNCFFAKAGKDQVAQIDKLLGNSVIVAAARVTHMACVAHEALLRDVELLQSVVMRRVPEAMLTAPVVGDIAMLEGERACVTARIASLDGRWRASTSAWATVEPALRQRIVQDGGDSLSRELSDTEAPTSAPEVVAARVRELEARVARQATPPQAESRGRTGDELRRELSEWRATPPDRAEPGTSEADVLKMRTEERAWTKAWAPTTCEMGDALARAAAAEAECASDSLTQACRLTSALTTRHELLCEEAARVGPPEDEVVDDGPPLTRETLDAALLRREALRLTMPEPPKRTCAELDELRRAAGQGLEDVASLVLHADTDVTRCNGARVAATQALADAELSAGHAEEEREARRQSADAHGKTRPPHAPPAQDVQRAHEAWRAARHELEARGTALTGGAAAALERRVEVLREAASTTLGHAATLTNRIVAQEQDAAASRARLSLAGANTPDFNPECEACRRQPWKVQLDRMREDQDASEQRLTGLQHELRQLLGAAPSQDLVRLRKTVGDASDWQAAWRACRLEGDDATWVARLTASRASDAWDSEHAVLQGIQDAAHAAQVASRRRAAAARVDADAASTACDRARALADSLHRQRLRIEELAEAEACHRTFQDWGLELAVQDGTCADLAQLHARSVRRAEWQVAMADWSDRRDAIACVVAALVLARLAETTARATSKRAADTHARYQLFLHERQLVWLPLATSLASESAAWEAWGPWRQHEAALERAAQAREALDAHEELEGARRSAAAGGRWTLLHHAVRVGAPAHACLTETEEGLLTARAELRVLDERLGCARGAAREHMSDLALIDVMRTCCATLGQRLTALRWLDGGLAAYHSWLYGNVVGPRLQHEVNVNLALLQGDAPDLHRIGLVGTWQDADGVFLWEMSDGAVGTVARGKGGGFQRASIGMCMRLALARISVVGTVSRHLFIDEGFTASDSANMSRVPRFLAGLLPRFDSITLVSHIDSLKEAASMAISITQYEDETGRTLSRVQHGRRGGEAAPPPKKTGRPKGRTRTAAVDAV